MNRRNFLWQSGGGLGGIALAQLLGENGLLAQTPGPRPEFNGGLHHRARAKRVVQCSCRARPASATPSITNHS